MKRDANGNRQQEHAGENVACAMANVTEIRMMIDTMNGPQHYNRCLSPSEVEALADGFEPPQEGLLIHLKPEDMEEATALWKDGRSFKGLKAGPGGPPDFIERPSFALSSNEVKRNKILEHISCLMGTPEFEFHKDGMTRVIDGILNE